MRGFILFRQRTILNHKNRPSPSIHKETVLFMMSFFQGDTHGCG